MSSTNSGGRDPLPEQLDDELNDLWEQAECELASLHASQPSEIKVRCEYRGAFDDEGSLEPGGDRTYRLGWGKVQRDWRICVGTVIDYSEEGRPILHWKPVTKCPRQLQVELADHYPRLRELVKAEGQKIAPRAVAAIESLKKALGD